MGDVVGSVTVVGGSLAGLSAARALRSQGYDGRITVVGEESRLPYDRPPLSKGFLVGTADQDDLRLLSEQDDGLDVEWRLGVRAVDLDVASRSVTLADGELLAGDGVVLATGARARNLPGQPPLPGVHVLRTVDDAVALRDDLGRGGPVVVVGGGFLGAEVASSVRALGLEVTVVEALPVPLAGALGPQLGAVCARLHEDHGTRLRTGTGVAGLLGSGHVEQVQLADGTRLDADVVVVAVGAIPNVEWLARSGLDVTDGVLTDAACGTGVPGIVAVGDCARQVDVHTGRPLRSEHWTAALQQPATAVATLLGTSSPYTELPYVWSEQYGRMLQLVGTPAAGDVVTVVDGSVEERAFVATYERGGELVAVLGLAAPRAFTRWRKSLRTAAAARSGGGGNRAGHPGGGAEREAG